MSMRRRDDIERLVDEELAARSDESDSSLADWRSRLTSESDALDAKLAWEHAHGGIQAVTQRAYDANQAEWQALLNAEATERFDSGDVDRL